MGERTMTAMGSDMNRRALLRGAAGVVVLGASAAVLTGCSGGGDRPASAGTFSGPFGVSEFQTIPYGPEEKKQYGVLVAPLQENGEPVTEQVPVVVMIHGGGWNDASDMSYMNDIAMDLVSHGVVVWSIAYRGAIHSDQTDRGPERPAWPVAGEDVAAAVDLVPRLAERSPVPLDMSRVITLGHSAGGHLATWAASRHRLRKGAVGAEPEVQPVGCVSMAGVYDLRTAYELDPEGAEDLMGGSPQEISNAYGEASPQLLLPARVPVIVCKGGRDEEIPASQADDYVAAARKRGDPVELVVVEDADHNAWTVLEHQAWATARDHVLTVAKV